MGVYLWTDEWLPTDNTIFYVKNNGDILDYSKYGHTMSWYWTSGYYTLPNWRKVADFDGTNLVYSATFTETINTTTFTYHAWMKNKDSTFTGTQALCGWRDRNESSISTTDRWGAVIIANNSSMQFVSWGATNWVWQSDDYLWINADTSDFYLYSYTLNWKTVNIYKNAQLVGTWTWSYNIIWWSNTPTHLYMGWIYGYDGRNPNAFSRVYMWENILENRIWTSDEITAYYNGSKGLYWL